MKKNFNLKNLAAMAAMAAFLLVPGMAHANCTIGAASALPYSVPAAGMTGALTISAPVNCPWTFTARGSAWVRILSATSGTGSAVVYYQFLPNTTGRARSVGFGPEGVAPPPSIPGRSNVSGGSTGFTITVTQAAQ
jgi:hypothetical protein